MPTSKRATARLCALLMCIVLLLVACQSKSQSPQGVSRWPVYDTIHGQTMRPGQPETLTVWALSEGIASSITMLNLVYMDEEPRDYDIRLIYAVPRKDLDDFGNVPSLQADEKLRLLITDLLGGEGPDILILDGCNARDFAVSGALMDLSGVASEAGVYENLTQSLMVGDALPYIPYLARAPLLWGEPALVQSIESFAHLAESLAAGPPPQWPGPFYPVNEDGTSTNSNNEDPLLLKVPPLPETQRAVVDFDAAVGFLNYDIEDLARAAHAPWLVRENSLDTMALREYFAATKQMYYANASEPFVGWRIQSLFFPRTSFQMGTSGASLYLGYTHLAAANTNFYQSYQVPALTALAKNRPIAVRSFPAEGAVWQPHTLMAVNKNTQNPELALQFIRMMLSDDYQLREYNGDLPVTQSAVKLMTEQRFAETLREAYDGYGSYGTYEKKYGEGFEGIQWLKEAEGFPYDLDALIRSFDTVYLPDTVVEEVVSANLTRYLSGEATLDEAVARCEEDLSLYFAERAR